MEILAKFDATGRRVASVVRGVHYTDDSGKKPYLQDGYVEISEGDWQKYVSNEYVRGENGKPVPVKATEMTLAQKADALYMECQRDMDELLRGIMSAVADSDDEALASFRQMRKERMEQYAADLAALGEA